MRSLGQTELGTDPRGELPGLLSLQNDPSLLRVKSAGSALCLTCRDR